MGLFTGQMPSSSDVYHSLGGLTIRDDLTSSILPRITFSPTIGITTRRLDSLGLNLRSFREPLQRAIKQVVIPSIQRNFDVGGRPAWQPLSESTLEVRRRFNISGDQILVRTGLLKRNMGFLSIWDISADTAILSHLPDRVWYGAIHQDGFEGSGSTRVSAKGLERIQAAQRQAMATGTPLGFSGGVNIPARPFVMLQEEDMDGILDVFSNWFQERIDAAWPLGSIL